MVMEHFHYNLNIYFCELGNHSNFESETLKNPLEHRWTRNGDPTHENEAPSKTKDYKTIEAN